MSEHQEDDWAEYIPKIARQFKYPPTPNTKHAVAKRFGWRGLPTIAAILLIGSMLFMFSSVRAAIRDFLQIGNITIFETEVPTRDPIDLLPSNLFGWAEETTLDQAQAMVAFTIRLPSILGTPDHVFVENENGEQVILVWLEPDNPEKVRFSLHQLGAKTFGGKNIGEVYLETHINGEEALWIEGTHSFEIWDAAGQSSGAWRLVNGNVLIWQEGDITYRLETLLSLDEARQVAESVR